MTVTHGRRGLAKFNEFPCGSFLCQNPDLPNSDSIALLEKSLHSRLDRALQREGSSLLLPTHSVPNAVPGPSVQLLH